MNKSHAQRIIDVMQAALGGKRIQYRRRSDLPWTDASYPTNLSWHWGDYEYRVKPAEPVKVSRFYLVDRDGDMWGAETDINGAPFISRSACDHSAIRYASTYPQYAPFQVVELTGSYVKA